MQACHRTACFFLTRAPSQAPALGKRQRKISPRHAALACCAAFMTTTQGHLTETLLPDGGHGSTARAAEAGPRLAVHGALALAQVIEVKQAPDLVPLQMLTLQCHWVSVRRTPLYASQLIEKATERSLWLEVMLQKQHCRNTQRTLTAFLELL